MTERLCVTYVLLACLLGHLCYALPTRVIMEGYTYVPQSSLHLITSEYGVIPKHSIQCSIQFKQSDPLTQDNYYFHFKKESSVRPFSRDCPLVLRIINKLGSEQHEDRYCQHEAFGLTAKAHGQAQQQGSMHISLHRNALTPTARIGITVLVYRTGSNERAHGGVSVDCMEQDVIGLALAKAPFLRSQHTQTRKDSRPPRKAAFERVHADAPAAQSSRHVGVSSLRRRRVVRDTHLVYSGNATLSPDTSGEVNVTDTSQKTPPGPWYAHILTNPLYLYITGGVGGAIVFIIVIVLCYCCFNCKEKKREKDKLLTDKPAK